MKTRTFLMIACLVVVPLTIPAETLLDADGVWKGAYSIDMKMIELDDEEAFMLGGRGGWTYDSTLFVGGALYGLITDVPKKKPVLYRMRDYRLFYLGLLNEYEFHQERKIHSSISFLTGVGAIGYWPNTHGVESHTSSDFVIFETALHMVFNVVPGYRIGLGLGYRLVHGVKLAGTTSTDLSGPSLTLAFRFGGE
ncbi:MAG: hypothetical protein JSU69_01605 [Candidatus Zixiibacteriota bacterium]|nr:MAG: hypothetical protein JSU69_01605 [candidate division Zixibacteria bacterium]